MHPACRVSKHFRTGKCSVSLVQLVVCFERKRFCQHLMRTYLVTRWVDLGNCKLVVVCHLRCWDHDLGYIRTVRAKSCSHLTCKFVACSMGFPALMALQPGMCDLLVPELDLPLHHRSTAASVRPDQGFISPDDRCLRG